MRKTTWALGLLFTLGALGACTSSVDDAVVEPAPANGPEVPNANAAPADPPSSNQAPAAPPSEAPSGEEPGEPGEPAPVADAGADADASAPKPKIPAPSQGTLIVTTNTGAMCEWTVGGVVKGTSSQLNTQLYGGTYDVACKRVSDAKVIAGKATITGSQTTNLALTFKGKVAATSNVACTWYFGGFVVGSPGTTYNAEHDPGTSSLKCAASDPSKGSQTKTIQIVSDTTTPVSFSF